MKTSPLISISSGQPSFIRFFGMSEIVFKFSVINSPSKPFPLDNPLTNFPFLYVRDAEIPSILGSTLYSRFVFLSKSKKLKIFFSKLIKSPLSNAFDKDNIGTLCLDFKKFLEGLKPTELEGESLLLKKGYFFSSSIISLLRSSYSLSEIFGLFFSK